MSPKRSRSLLRLVLLGLPLLTVAVLGFAALGPASLQPYRFARVSGGPTESTGLAVQLELVERIRDLEAPLAQREVTLSLARQGQRVQLRGTSDARGRVYLVTELGGQGPLELEVHADGVLLAQGRAEVTERAFAAKLRSRGGWLQGATEGSLEVRAAPRRGVFAVPFADELVLEVTRDGAAVSDARVTVALDGIDVGSAVTSARGRATLTLTPVHHAQTVRVSALAGDASGSMTAPLAVLPGAFDARPGPEGVTVRAPIERDVAYVALLTPSTRLAHAALELKPDGRGGSLGSWRVSTAGASHVLVSSEPDFASPAAVGWPLVTDGETFATTLSAPDLPWVDGGPARHAVERTRQGRAKLVAAGFVAAAALLALALLLLENRRSSATLFAHLERAGSTVDEVDRATARRTWPLVVLSALAAVLLGFAIVALVMLTH
ncbi:MAG: hypothetical protein KF718_05235 [Polyangiaceae bacterium]|nr:hypothetical protein [Polyangiaceae bacterium]